MKMITMAGVLSILFAVNLFGQSSVAITIDDVPNTVKFERDGFHSKLMDKLDSMDIPVAIFINEGLLFKTDSMVENFALLNEWAKRENVTLGNHTFNHSSYSEVGFDTFKLDVDKGAYLTQELSTKYQKELKYFRFPYNNLGKDSLQHQEIKDYLIGQEYIITPFTVESSDWMFSYIYEHYLKEGKKEEAKRVAETYIEKTLAYFDFYEAMVAEQYGRKIKHIYLCHDNSLNADYLEILITKLKERDYNFISLDEAMGDKVYQQKDLYTKQWGVSWLYRWMSDNKERTKLMKQEPDMSAIQEEYKKITSNTTP
ncbi:polysaccharide deacetylase family protein [Limibacter armeniacum]|uniref:polysaccharide deacetylase family protein n=1 Tax=Limibacter armeniacum TaxID=466084 RepID=UPI002FE55A33